VKNRETQIYVALLEEGVEVWRPVVATPLVADLFRIVDDPAPESEHREFAPGSMVRCHQRIFGDGSRGLVAYELAAEDPKTVRTWLEFHDSTLARVGGSSAGAEIVFESGYIHRWEIRAGRRVGTGWTQRVRLQLSAPSSAKEVFSGSVRVSDGKVMTPQASNAHLLRVPGKLSEPVHVWIQLIDFRELRASGASIEATLEGTPVFVEALPADLDPGLEDQGRGWH